MSPMHVKFKSYLFLILTPLIEAILRRTKMFWILNTFSFLIFVRKIKTFVLNTHDPDRYISKSTEKFLVIASNIDYILHA